MAHSIEKLRKILRLEVTDHHYKNKAIIGGIARLIPNWEDEARRDNLSPDLITEISEQLQAYDQLDFPGRQNAIRHLLSLLQADNGELPPPSQNRQNDFTKPQPEPFRAKPIPSRNSQPPAAVVRSKTPPEAAYPSQDIERLLRELAAPVSVLPGIGANRFDELKSLGIHSIWDMLYYFPRRYDDFSTMKPINRIELGDELSVFCKVQSITKSTFNQGKGHKTEAVVTDGSGYLRVTWFGRYQADKIRPQDKIILQGKVGMYLGRLVMNNPSFDYPDEDQFEANFIPAVYPVTAGLTSKFLRLKIREILQRYATRIPEHLPADILQSAELMPITRALSQIHLPESNELRQKAQYRLAFDEIFLLQLGVIRQKMNWNSSAAAIYTVPEEWWQQRVSSFPYALTNAQEKTLQEIRADLQSGQPMNRLLQGDVGSGKTVVAALAMSIVAYNGKQSALMAPTSILAEQHYQTLLNLLADPQAETAPLKPSEIRLLVGDTNETDRNEIRQGLSDGSIKIIVGTHALLEDPVQFASLQLAVIDEQHRFGVEQRATLRAKGENPHLLVMTATPIPRSLALTIYGDLELSVIDELPVGRIPIDTYVLHPLDRERAYHVIQSHVERGFQAFIICPLVEQGENNEESKAAVEEHSRLQNEVFPNLKLGLLHGRMRPDEKDAVMEKFRSGEFHILVSTSVIEVGVDVPRATVMLIEGANRFGLSQLHQFRGRVGRGTEKSICLLIPETEDSLENERLQVMTQTNDGFLLAEKDLEQRGPGDFLGTRQSGFADLKLAKLTDVRLIEKARGYAQQIFEKDPELKDPSHYLLSKTLERFWSSKISDIS